jgi:hypothetical protein
LSFIGSERGFSAGGFDPRSDLNTVAALGGWIRGVVAEPREAVVGLAAPVPAVTPEGSAVAFVVDAPVSVGEGLGG